MAIQTLDSILEQWMRIDELLFAAAQRSFLLFPLEAVAVTPNKVNYTGSTSENVSINKTCSHASIRLCHSENARSTAKRNVLLSSSTSLDTLVLLAYNSVHEYLSWFRKLESFTHLELLKEMLRASVVGWLTQFSLATRGSLRLPLAYRRHRRREETKPKIRFQESSHELSSNASCFTSEKGKNSALSGEGLNLKEGGEDVLGNAVAWKSDLYRKRWIHFTRVLRRRWCKSFLSTSLFQKNRREKERKGSRESSYHYHGSKTVRDEEAMPSNFSLSSRSEHNPLAHKTLNELAIFAAHYDAFLQFLKLVFTRLVHIPPLTKITVSSPMRLLEETLILEMRYFLWENKETLLSALRFAVNEILSSELCLVRNECRTLQYPSLASRLLYRKVHHNRTIRAPSLDGVDTHTYLRANTPASRYAYQASIIIALVEQSHLEELQKSIGDMMEELCYQYGTVLIHEAFAGLHNQRRSASNEGDEKGMASFPGEGPLPGVGHHEKGLKAFRAPSSSSFTWMHTRSAFHMLHALRRCVGGYRCMHDMIWTLCKGNLPIPCMLGTSSASHRVEEGGSGAQSSSRSVRLRHGEPHIYDSSIHPKKSTSPGWSSMGNYSSSSQVYPVDMCDSGGGKRMKNRMWWGRPCEIGQLSQWGKVILKKALTGYLDGVGEYEGLISIIQREGVPLWRLSCEQQLYTTHGVSKHHHQMSRFSTPGRGSGDEEAMMQRTSLTRPPHPLWPWMPLRKYPTRSRSATVSVAALMVSKNRKEQKKEGLTSRRLQEKCTQKLDEESGEADSRMRCEYDAILRASPAEGYPSLLLVLYLLGPARQKFVTALHERITVYLTELLHQYDEINPEKASHEGSPSASSLLSITSLPLPALVLEECIYLLKMNRLCFEHPDVECLCSMTLFNNDTEGEDEKKWSAQPGEFSGERAKDALGLLEYESLFFALKQFAMETASCGIRKFFAKCEMRVAATLAYALEYYVQILIRKNRTMAMPERNKKLILSGEKADDGGGNDPLVVIQILIHLASLLSDPSIFSKFYAELLSPRALVANSYSELQIDHFVVDYMKTRLGFFSASSCILLLRDLAEAIHDRRSAIILAPNKKVKRESKRQKLCTWINADSLVNDVMETFGIPRSILEGGLEISEDHTERSENTLKLPLGLIHSDTAKPNYLMRRLKVLRISRWRPYVTLLETSSSIKKMFERGNWLSEAFVDAVLRAEWNYNHTEDRRGDPDLRDSCFSGYGSFCAQLDPGISNIFRDGFENLNERRRGRMGESDQDSGSFCSDKRDESDSRSTMSCISQSTTSVVAGLSSVLSSAFPQVTRQTRGFKVFTRNGSLGNDDSDDEDNGNETVNDGSGEVAERPSSLASNPHSNRASGSHSPSNHHHRHPHHVGRTDGANTTNRSPSGGGVTGSAAVSRSVERSASWFSLSNLTSRSVASTTTSFRTTSSTTGDDSMSTTVIREEEKRKMLWSLGCGLLNFTVSEDVPYADTPSKLNEGKGGYDDSSLLSPCPSPLHMSDPHHPEAQRRANNNVEQSPCSHISISIRGPPIALILLQLLDRASATHPLSFNRIVNHLPLRVPKPIVGQILKIFVTCGLVERILHSVPKVERGDTGERSYQYGYYMTEHLSSSMPPEVNITVHYRMVEECTAEDAGNASSRKHTRKRFTHACHPPLSAFAPLTKEETDTLPSPSSFRRERSIQSGAVMTVPQTSCVGSSIALPEHSGVATEREVPQEETKKIEQLKKARLHVAIIRCVKKETVMTHNALFDRLSAEMGVTPIKFKNAIEFLLEREYLYRSSSTSYCLNKPAPEIRK